MARSRTIRVIPNLQKCLEELQAALKSMTAGDMKKRAEGALDYLSRTFKGERQPMKGRNCPPHRQIIII